MQELHDCKNPNNVITLKNCLNEEGIVPSLLPILSTFPFSAENLYFLSKLPDPYFSEATTKSSAILPRCNGIYRWQPVSPTQSSFAIQYGGFQSRDGSLLETFVRQNTCFFTSIGHLQSFKDCLRIFSCQELVIIVQWILKKWSQS